MLVKRLVPSTLPTLSLLVFIAHLREKYYNIHILQMKKERLGGVGGVGRGCVASKWWPGLLTQRGLAEAPAVPLYRAD